MHACSGSLQVTVFPDDRVLELTLHHRHHSLYIDRAMSCEALDFATTRIQSSTPALIYRQLVTSDLPGAETVPQYQVHYLWSRRPA